MHSHLKPGQSVSLSTWMPSGLFTNPNLQQSHFPNYFYLLLGTLLRLSNNQLSNYHLVLFSGFQIVSHEIIETYSLKDC